MNYDYRDDCYQSIEELLQLLHHCEEVFSRGDFISFKQGNTKEIIIHVVEVMPVLGERGEPIDVNLVGQVVKITYAGNNIATLDYSKDGSVAKAITGGTPDLGDDYTIEKYSTTQIENIFNKIKLS